MVKLANASKMVAATAVISLSTMAFGVAPAFATTNNCVNTKDDLCVTWDGKGKFVIYPQHNYFSSNLQLHASSYTITNPNYKGGDFTSAGATAYPQTLNTGSTQNIAVTQGNYAPITVNVSYPDCGNVQVDLYDGAEVTSVGSNGHGSQYIAGNIIQPFNTKVCGGGQGGGTPTPVTPVTPASTTPAPVAAPQLADTGVNVKLTGAIAAVLAAAAAFVATRRSKVSE